MEKESSQRAQDDKVLARINFLNQIPDVKKENTGPAGLHTLLNDKLFITEPRPNSENKIKRARITRVGSISARKQESSENQQRPPSQERPNSVASNLLQRLNIKEQISDLISWRATELCVSSFIPELAQNVGQNNNAIPNINNFTSPRQSLSKVISPRSGIAIAPVKSIPKLPLASLKLKSRPQTAISEEFAFVRDFQAEKGNAPLVIHSNRSTVNEVNMRSRESSVENNGSKSCRNRVIKRPMTGNKSNRDIFMEKRRASDNVVLSDCLVYRPLLTERLSTKGVRNVETTRNISDKENRNKNFEDMMVEIRNKVKRRGQVAHSSFKVKSLINLN